MIFGHNPSSPRRFVAVTGGFDRFEPTDRGVKTVSDGHSIGFRLTLDVPSLGRLLEREWGLRP